MYIVAMANNCCRMFPNRYRMSKCRCEPIGCDWQGVWSKLQQHETTCEFLNKSPDNIIQCLEIRKAAKAPVDLEQAKLLDLLSAEGVTYTG